MTAAQQLTLSHVPSQPDREAQVRATFRAAYSMSRRMMRSSPNHTVGARYPWTVDALRARFGASGWPVAQAAASLVFERRIISGAATGVVADLEHQGLVRHTRRPRKGDLVGVVPYRCVSFERTHGIAFAWGGDELACVDRRVALRKGRARDLRAQRAEDAARRRQIAAALAADRVALERGRFYALTDLGRAALAAA